MRAIALAAVLAALTTTGPVFAEETLSGIATAIDGGTLEIGGTRYVLWGIAAPDPSTPRGWVTKLYVKVAVASGPVSCREKAPGRWQCLTTEGSDLGSLLVQTGQAQAADSYYRYEEDRARVSGVGIWGDRSK